VKIGGAGVCRTDLHIIEGQVTLHTKTYPLDAAPEALADLDAGRVRGWAILVQ
jgi:D-arabinose 1-dehydrogenase-like Zn-dependent alcohol dehydrogenase